MVQFVGKSKKVVLSPHPIQGAQWTDRTHHSGVLGRPCSPRGYILRPSTPGTSFSSKSPSFSIAALHRGHTLQLQRAKGSSRRHTPQLQEAHPSGPGHTLHPQGHILLCQAHALAPWTIMQERSSRGQTLQLQEDHPAALRAHLSTPEVHFTVSWAHLAAPGGTPLIVMTTAAVSENSAC